MTEHEFGGVDGRCRFCGTLQSNPVQAAQSCVPHRGVEKLRPEPTRRDYAANDADTISARLAELKAEREAAMNEPPAALSITGNLR